MFRILLLSTLFFANLFAHNDKIDYKKYFEENTNIMFFINPKNGKIIKANKSAADFYGYKIKKLEKMSINDLNTFTKEQVSNEMKKAKELKRNYFLFAHKLANGDIQKVRVFSSPLILNGKEILYSTIYPLVLEEEFLDYFNETLEKQVELQTKQIKKNEEKIGKIYFIVFILLALALFISLSNLIKRTKLAKALSKSNERFTLAMESTKDGLWDWNPVKNKVYFNENFKKMLGFSDEEMPSNFNSWYSKLHPEDKDRVLNDVNNHLEGKTPFYESTFRLKHKDGSWVGIFSRGKAHFDENGVATRVLGFQTDITKQNNLLNELEKQKLEYEAIFEYAKDGIVVTDLDLNILNCNQEFLKMTSYSKEEILNKNCSEFDIDNTPNKEEMIESVFKNSHIENIEKNIKVAGEKRLRVNLSASLLPDKKSILILLHDITVVKLMEEQSKLASMGEMIGNIAHQWRQPLSIITTASSGVAFKLEFGQKVDKEEIKDISRNIVDQAKYLSKTIDDFRNFVKGDKTEKLISIKDTISDVINLTKATIDNNYIKLIADIEDDISIYANKNELEQSFINIINNAKDALKENVLDDDDKFLFISTRSIDNKTLVLKILDSGGGIPTSILDRIFEPYFTTKHQSVGTGIGLSMVDKILRKRHNAKIDVFNKSFEYENKTYKGAVFNITFTKN